MINSTHQNSGFWGFVCLFVFKLRINLHWHIIISQSPKFMLGVHSWSCTFYGFGHKYDGIYPSSSIFTPLNTHCDLPIYLSLPSFLTLATIPLFVSTVLLFSKCHMVESFFMWPFQIGFFHLIICIESSSILFNDLVVHFFKYWNIFHCLDVPQFTYPFTC